MIYILYHNIFLCVAIYGDYLKPEKRLRFMRITLFLFLLLFESYNFDNITIYDL